MGLIHMLQSKEQCPDCNRKVWTLLFNGTQDVCIKCHEKTHRTAPDSKYFHGIHGIKKWR